MTSFMSILPMIILIILSFLTPTRLMMQHSSSYSGGQVDDPYLDLKNCVYALEDKCGSRNKFPTAQNCASMAILFWDDETFSDVQDERVQGVLDEYYRSFGQNIFRRNLLGPAEYCYRMVSGVQSQEECNDQLQEFRDGPAGPNGPEGPNYLTTYQVPPFPGSTEIQSVVVNQGDAPSPAIRYGLYNTKLIKYVPYLTYANAHNIASIINEGVLQPYMNRHNTENLPYYYSVRYMLYLSTGLKIDKNVLNDPKDYCIQRFHPHMLEHLSNIEAAYTFFFRNRQ